MWASTHMVGEKSQKFRENEVYSTVRFPSKLWVCTPFIPYSHPKCQALAISQELPEEPSELV